jgi:glycopeptide antibiotics resistance protein
MMNRRNLGYLIVIVSVIFVLLATLYPFEFIVFPWDLPNAEYASLRDVLGNFENASSIKDYWCNILFFMPLGVGLACILNTTKLKLRSISLIALVISFALSLTVETLQVFLPVRVPNITDLITNTLGGFFGVYLYWYKNLVIEFFCTVISRDKTKIKIKSVATSFGIYFACIFIAILVALLNVNLKNWDRDFRIILGNEFENPRPWQGYISHLEIADRALSEPEIKKVFAGKNDSLANNLPEIFTAYSFDNRAIAYKDKFNNTEPLIWQTDISSDEERSKLIIEERLSQFQLDINRGVLLNYPSSSNNRWLETERPVTKLIDRLETTNEFTLNTVIASQNLEQTGPARIFSISKNSFHRNLTLGQDKSSLALRLRTPVTGDNGTEPELILPKVFLDRELHHVLITFKKDELNFYIDRSERHYTFRFTPEITFLSYLPWSIKFWHIDISKNLNFIYPLSFYTIAFLPLGFIGGLWLSLLKNKLFKLVLTGCICVLPALIIEQLYVTISGHSVRGSYLLLSIAILSITTLFTEAVYWKRVKFNTN